jgi:hypothetical protein
MTDKGTIVIYYPAFSCPDNYRNELLPAAHILYGNSNKIKDAI